MEIHSLKVENFKCFENLDLNFSKITLITGANSSGKSSIIYSILGSIQSGEFPLQFSPNGKYVRMGDFNDIVNNHDTGKTIRVQIDTVNDDAHTIYDTYWIEDRSNKLPVLTKLNIKSDYFNFLIEKIRKFHLTFNYQKGKDPLASINSPEFMKKLFGSMNTIFNEFTRDVEDNKKDEQKKELENIITRFSNIKEKIHFTLNELDHIDNDIRNKGNYWLEHTFNIIKSTFQRFDQKLNFISSFRLYPERTYYEKSQKDLKVGRFGESYEDQIIFWESKNAPEYRELIQIMRELELFDDIRTRRFEGGRYEILIKNKKGGIYSSLSDVGFGISQFLPIIVADLQLKKNSLLFVAQPEIHLHPSVQAQFSNYVVNRMKDANKRYIIETHSEYLINRLRLLITKGIIKANDVSVIYLENDGKKVDQHNLHFTKSGKIENAPQSFFDTYMLDAMNIALSAE